MIVTIHGVPFLGISLRINREMSFGSLTENHYFCTINNLNSWL